MQMYNIFLAMVIIMIIIILVYIPFALICVRKLYKNTKNMKDIEDFNYSKSDFDESNDDPYGRLSTILEEDMEEIEKIQEGYTEIKNTNDDISMIIEINGEISIVF